MRMNVAPPQRLIAKRCIVFVITFFSMASAALTCSDRLESEANFEQTALARLQQETQAALAPTPANTEPIPVEAWPTSVPSLAPTNIVSITASPSLDPLKTTPPTQASGVSITVTKATPYANNTRVMIEVFVKNLGGEAVTILEDQLFVADSNGKLANTQLHIATMVGNAERSVRATSFIVPPNGTVKIFLLAPTTCRPNLHIRYALTAATIAACP